MSGRSDYSSLQRHTHYMYTHYRWIQLFSESRISMCSQLWADHFCCHSWVELQDPAAVTHDNSQGIGDSSLLGLA